MRIYPNSHHAVIPIRDADRFIKSLGAVTEEYAANTDTSCVFLGNVRSDHFKISIKSWYGNKLRPEIQGRIINGDLHLSIGVKQSTIILPIALLIVFQYGFWGNWVAQIVGSPIILLLYFLLDWALYSMDYAETKNAFYSFLESNIENKGDQ